MGSDTGAGGTGKKTVFPGDFISYAEEYSAGPNAFEEDDKVFSLNAGTLAEDAHQRKAGVAAFKKVRLVKAGDLVEARVEDVYDQIALISFEPVQARVGEEVSSFTRNAYLRISEVLDGYAEGFRNNIAVGDVLKARVCDVTPMGVYLSIADKALGVERAFCSNCRSELKNAGGGQWFCVECGNKELRKTPFVEYRAEPRRGGGFGRPGGGGGSRDGGRDRGRGPGGRGDRGGGFRDQRGSGGGFRDRSGGGRRDSGGRREGQGGGRWGERDRGRQPFRRKTF